MARDVSIYEPRISAHAIQRCRQRIDANATFDDICAALLRPSVVDAICLTERNGGEFRVIVGGLEVYLRDGFITTVMPRAADKKMRLRGLTVVTSAERRAWKPQRMRRAQHWRAALRHQGVI